MANENTPHSASEVLNRVPGVGILDAYGKTVPTDGEDGYATGCLFRHTDGGGGTSLYVNEGTLTSCNFDPVTTG